MAVTETTDTQFNDLIAKNPRVVVKFFADWCGTCKLFAPKFRRMSENEAYKDVVFLDINAEENPEARKLAGVTNLPTFAVFKDGKLVKSDFTSKEETVTQMIQSILA